MKFCRYVDAYSMFKRDRRAKKLLDGMDYQGFYTRFKNHLILIGADDPFATRQSDMEREWIRIGRPYYNVWPAILPMVEKLSLDFTSEFLPDCREPLVLQLPEDGDLSVKCPETGLAMKSLIFHEIPDVREKVRSRKMGRGMICAIDFGETQGDMPSYTFKIFPLITGKTIQASLDTLESHWSIDIGEKITESVVSMGIKLACCVCLIGKDPELVKPDLLSQDRPKVNPNISEAELQRFIDRARKRGKGGFDLGRDLETIPHNRRPHMALVWTGKGRQVPKVVMRKGSIVHRNRLTKVPTGKYGSEKCL